MLPELGNVLLILALLVTLLQAVLPLAGAQWGNRVWMAVARPAAFVHLALLVGAFAVLTHAFVTQDFSVRYVAENSNSLLPLAYRYSAVWGAHEGSLLLWALMLALWTTAVALTSRRLPEQVMARVIGTLAIISLGFLAFLLFTSTPFARLLPAPVEGGDLNPLLQDPGLIVHPPMLYAGYVGFSVPFAFAIAALLEGRIDSQWLRWVRPWTNLAWALLTLGIALGSWWAYYELGWGGWWFWDPVENASFMPWLVGTALLHSQAVTEKRGSFGGWTLLLAIAAFSLSLLGTFLVRSGVLTSVHAFAADPSRGLFVLAFLLLVVGSSLLLYALRAAHLDNPAAPERQRCAGCSRETLLLCNNLLLTCACAMVLLGTLYPMLADALNLGKLSVGPPYFSTLFWVMMAPLVALLPLGPLTRWQREQASQLMALLMPWAILALGAATLTWLAAPQGRLKAALGILGASWVLLGTLRFVTSRWRVQGRRFTAEMLGMCLAHAGVAVFLAGALLVESLSVHREVALAPGQSLPLGSYQLHFDRLEQQSGPNYLADRAQISLLRAKRRVAILYPEKRRYASGGQTLTEVGIHPALLGDVYVALGEPLGNDTWAVRAQLKPFVRWIWLGALLMALGGFVTAVDRRFRCAPERR